MCISIWAPNLWFEEGLKTAKFFLQIGIAVQKGLKMWAMNKAQLFNFHVSGKDALRKKQIKQYLSMIKG